MNTVTHAIQDVLRVRDAEREDEASTEDLLDAVAGLDAVVSDAIHLYDKIEDLTQALDTVLFHLDTDRPDPSIIASVMEEARETFRGTSNEPLGVTDLRHILREKHDFDSTMPMLPNHESFLVCVSARELASIEVPLKQLTEIVGLEVTITPTPSGDLLPLFDVEVKRVKVGEA